MPIHLCITLYTRFMRLRYVYGSCSCICHSSLQLTTRKCTYCMPQTTWMNGEQSREKTEKKTDWLVPSIAFRCACECVPYATRLCVCVYWCYFSFRTLQCATLNSVDIPNRVDCSTCERVFCCGENECVWKNLCRISKTTAELWLIEKWHLTVVHATTLRKLFCNKIRLFIFFSSLSSSLVFGSNVFLFRPFLDDYNTKHFHPTTINRYSKMGKRNIEHDTTFEVTNHKRRKTEVIAEDVSPPATAEIVDGVILTDLCSKKWRCGKPIGKAHPLTFYVFYAFSLNSRFYFQQAKEVLEKFFWHPTTLCIRWQMLMPNTSWKLNHTKVVRCLSRFIVWWKRAKQQVNYFSVSIVEFVLTIFVLSLCFGQMTNHYH